jgi:hypothetical protein
LKLLSSRNPGPVTVKPTRLEFSTVSTRTRFGLALPNPSELGRKDENRVDPIVNSAPSKSSCIVNVAALAAPDSEMQARRPRTAVTGRIQPNRTLRCVGVSSGGSEAADAR